MKWAPSASSYILDKFTRLTKQAAKAKPDLIVWPEASSPEVLGEQGAIFKEIFALAKDIRTPVLIGAVVKEGQGYFNSALLIDARGKISGRYDKLHLVPFGEYIPLKRFLPFLEAVVPIGDIAAGREYTIFTLPATYYPLPAKFSVLICFEDLFPELSRQFVKTGVQFLVNITNDAWYKKTAAASQHLQASVFRAVENRVFLVRSANTGVSGFISPAGKIISKVADLSGVDIFIDGVDTQGLVLKKRPHTIYTRYGDFLVIVCVLFAFYGIIRALKYKP